MDREIRILVVDDSEDDAKLITLTLDNKNFAHTSKWVASKDAFLKSLEEYAPDIILCDYKMPSFGAPEALEIVKERFPETPFIVVSGTVGEDIAVEMMRSGAVDYIMKENLIRLVPAVQRAAKEAEEHAQHKQATESLLRRENQFQELFNHMSSGVAIYKAKDDGEDFIILDINEAAEHSSRVSRKEVIGKSVLQIFPGVIEIGLFKVFQQVWKTGKPQRCPVSFYQDKRFSQWVENYIYKLPSGEIVAIYDDVTERRKAEIALLQSEEKYRGMVDNISIGVALISPEMEILFLNNQMKKWNPHIDLKDKHICYYAFNNPPRTEICPYCPTAKTLKDGLVHESVTETPMNGKVFNYKIISSPIKDEKDRIIAAIEMVEDITEHKRAEEKLRENHALLSSLADRAPGALYQFKLYPDGHFSMPFASARFFNNFGVTPSELQEDASKLFKAIHPEDIEGVLASIRESARTLNPWEHEFRAVLPDGKIVWQRANSRPEKLPDNSILWHGFIWDITERKNMENTLRSKTALLEAQTNSTIDGILIVDENGKRILINQRFIDMVRTPESVLTDENDTALLQHVTSLTKYPDKFLEKIRHLNSHPGETSRDEIEFKNGMILDRYSAPVLDKSGKNYGRIWTFRDITEQKHLERESKRRLEELEIFHKASVGREERILELKQKVEELKRALEK